MKSQKEPDKIGFKDFIWLIILLSGIIILIIFYIGFDVWNAKLPLSSRGDEFPCSGLTIIYVIILIIITIGSFLIYKKSKKKM